MKRSTKLLRQFRKQTFTKCWMEEDWTFVLNLLPAILGCSVQFSLIFARHVLKQILLTGMMDRGMDHFSLCSALLQSVRFTFSGDLFCCCYFSLSILIDCRLSLSVPVQSQYSLLTVWLGWTLIVRFKRTLGISTSHDLWNINHTK